ERQSFGREASASFFRRRQWERWLVLRCKGRVHVLHSADIMAVGRIVRRAHKRLRIPYIVHVSPGELERIRERAARSRVVRRTARLVLGDAAGVVATTAYCEELARDVMAEVGISQLPPVAAMGLGTDPALFGPGLDSGTLRQRWGIRHAPIVLTTARLLPHKGQDIGIHAISILRDEFPNLRYVLVGEGSDEARLRNLAADLNVMDRIGFAGAMRDDELPEAYATSTIYLDASRAEAGANAHGHGISLIEAQATSLPVVASDCANFRTMIQDATNGIIVDPTSAASVASAIAVLLRDEDVRNEMGMAGREAVETYLNWNRMARDTARFVRECVASG
ncbi:MAG TPA: glycosyltransferase family 4 protein, partial [Gemmatimonadaceae bacterium]